MSTLLNTTTRPFRFGAIVHEAHQELAFQLADLEDRLNEELVLEVNPSGIKRIYFIPTITAAEICTAEQDVIFVDEESLVIELACPTDFGLIITRFLAALRQSGCFSEGFVARLEHIMK